MSAPIEKNVDGAEPIPEDLADNLSKIENLIERDRAIKAAA